MHDTADGSWHYFTSNNMPAIMMNYWDGALDATYPPRIDVIANYRPVTGIKGNYYKIDPGYSDFINVVNNGDIYYKKRYYNTVLGSAYWSIWLERVVLYSNYNSVLFYNNNTAGTITAFGNYLTKPIA